MRKTTVRIFAATMAILLLALTLVACATALSHIVFSIAGHIHRTQK